jgi:choline dehydrogenase-like flavoprotein
VLEGASVADVLVVGGGSAGCVLVVRLSEDPGCGVTLLESAQTWRAPPLVNRAFIIKQPQHRQETKLRTCKHLTPASFEQ